MPFFSVILPTFNRAHLIERALKSLLAQTYRDFECMIVDDGSTDDTFSVVRPYLLQDERLRYHFAQNRGLAGARNIGIATTSGTFVTFLDSDDMYAPTHLETRAQALDSQPTIDLLHGGVEVIGEAFVADKNDPTKK